MKIILFGVYPISIFSNKELKIKNPQTFTPSCNYNLAKALAQINGNDVHFITMDPSIRKDTIIKKDNITIHFLSSYSYFRFFTLFQYNKFKIHKELRKIKLDIIYGHRMEHEYPYIAVTTIYIVGKFNSSKYVRT